MLIVLGLTCSTMNRALDNITEIVRVPGVDDAPLRTDARGGDGGVL
jgi:hypothetical protein